MKTFVTALFVVAAVMISMVLGKYIVSTRDWRVRIAILVGSLLLWTACVWLMMLYWLNARAN